METIDPTIQLFRRVSGLFLAALTETHGPATTAKIIEESGTWLALMETDPIIRDSITVAVLSRLARMENEIAAGQAPGGPSTSFPA